MLRTAKQARQCICPILHKGNVETLKMTTSAAAQFQLKRSVLCQAPNCMAWTPKGWSVCDKCGRKGYDSDSGHECQLILNGPLHVNDPPPEDKDICHGSMILSDKGYCKLIFDK